MPTGSPVFAGPYQARRIHSAEQLLHAVRMLAWRPVSMALCVAPTQFVHSALRFAVGLDRLEGYEPSALLHLFGASAMEGRAALRSSVVVRPTEVEILQWELDLGIALASGAVGPLGSMSRQVRGAASVLVAASETKSIAGALVLLERWVEVRLRARGGQDLAARSDHLAARARAVVGNLAVQIGLCSAGAVARHFNRAKATLSEQMAASRKRPIDRQILSTPSSRIVEEAVALAVRRKT
jgi:hypothetical protein